MYKEKKERQYAFILRSLHFKFINKSPMSIQESIILSIQKGLKELYQVEEQIEKISLQDTKPEFEGSLTFVCFPYVGRLKMNPVELGTKLGEFITNDNESVKGFNVVKGFLNLEIADSAWLSSLSDLIKGESSIEQKKEKVMVEYSSPNTNKPLHLGHLRNNFLGYSLSQILRAGGYEVTMANLINDRGIHICKSMLAYEKFGEGETPESANNKGDHLVGKYYVEFDKHYKEEIKALMDAGKSEDDAKKEAPLMIAAQDMLRKWESGNEEVRALWSKMNQWVYDGFNSTYERIGVSFDKFYYESDTFLLGKDIVEEGLEKEVFFKKDDNSVWADLTDMKMDQKLVLRGDGTSVYITQDMGTADLKYNDFNVDRSIYVVGNEQEYHFKVLKGILSKMERPYADGIYHLSYGMVELPHGKMKSREGTVVDADDLIASMVETAKERTIESGKIDGFTEEEARKLYLQLALGALKYYILKVDPKRTMLFNPEESIDFQGDTGVFIQFTHARISALLRTAEEMGIAYDSYENAELSEFEVKVIENLIDYDSKVQEAADKYAPSIIANYVYDLAKSFSRMYTELPIFKNVSENEQKVRLAIASQAAQVIKKSLGLLGIEAPERM